eukprot:4804547-Pyramimonas_sp.AAC.1
MERHTVRKSEASGPTDGGSFGSGEAKQGSTNGSEPVDCSAPKSQHVIFPIGRWGPSEDGSKHGRGSGC